MNTTRRPKKHQTSHWFILLVLIVLVISIHFVFRQKLKDYSQSKLIEVQEKVANCKWFQMASRYFALFGNELIICVILLLVYNFGNIFKFVTLLTSLQISCLLIAMFQLIYLSDQSLMSNNRIDSYVTHVTFGDPSITVLLSTVFYLTFHQITFISSRFDGKVWMKRLGFAFAVLIIIIISALIWVLGINSLDQILFGFALGYCVYFLYFFVLNVNSNNPMQLLKLIDFPIYYYIIMILAIIFGYFLLFFFKYDQKETVRIFGNLKQFKGKEMAINCDLSLYKANGLIFVLFLSNIGTILGLKMEYKFLFDRNYINWLQYNFEKDEDKSDEDSLYSKLCINKDIQWNHTGFFLSLMRLAFIAVLLFISIYLLCFLKLISNHYLILLFIVLIGGNLICFGLCFIYKQLLKWLKVTNITLFTILRESI